ncbi:hypothetical protein GGF37_005445, partial [Kickxella alabastrina]
MSYYQHQQQQYHHQHRQQQQQAEGVYAAHTHELAGMSNGNNDTYRRRRRSSGYAMNVDTPTTQPNYAYHHQQQQQHPQYGLPSPNDYISYATTTAHMVDPWSMNHATLLANLSRLPPELLPSLLPQINQLQQHQQHQNQQIAGPNISALAAAQMAAVAVSTAMGSMQNMQ